MKLSKYVTNLDLDENKKMLYSTLERKYILYDKSEEKNIILFLSQLNKGTYTENEIELFKELVQKKMILQDDIDEEKKLEILENADKYQDNIYKLMIYATNACNFRCTYCEQPHVVKQLDEETRYQILALIERHAKKSKTIQLDWFGGEPLLEYENICDMLEKANCICKENGSKFISSFTTNGYLLNEKRIKKLKELNTKCMQITLDGTKNCHDKRRVLADGNGTFDVILKNLIAVVNEGICVTLRVNIDSENSEDMTELLESIPRKLRTKIAISISNIFQNTEKISTFNLYKQAIEKGYLYINRWNMYAPCHACQKNAIVIDTDGSILLCAGTDEDEKRVGYIGAKGNVCLEREAALFDLHSTTARNNPDCRDCIELPFCIGSCRYARMKENTKCQGKSNDGLSLHERALLDYYSDIQKIQGGTDNE